MESNSGVRCSAMLVIINKAAPPIHATRNKRAVVRNRAFRIRVSTDTSDGPFKLIEDQGFQQWLSALPCLQTRVERASIDLSECCSTAELSSICNFTALEYFSPITDNRVKDKALPIRHCPDAVSATSIRTLYTATINSILPSSKQLTREKI